MFFVLSKTLDLILAPLSWALGLIVVGLLTRRRVPALAGLLVLVAFSFEPLSNALELAVERGATRTYRPDVSYDAVILLGGLVEKASASGVPSYNDNVERLLVTYDLLRTRHAEHAILSGGVLDPADPTLAEATVLARQLADWGIDPGRILVEAHSRNTRENALDSKRIVEQRHFSRLLIVTSAFHMPRALGCFRAVGLTADALPVDYRAYDPARFMGSWLPRAMYLDRSTMAIREWAGREIYRLEGYAR